MKTMIKYFVMMLILSLADIVYCYKLEIYNPNECPGRISPLFYPNTTIQVKFRFEILHALDQQLGRCKISVRQNNSFVTMFDNILDAGTTHSIPINAGNLPGFCLNESAIINIEVNPIDHLIPYSTSGLFIVYKSGEDCNNICLKNGTAQLLHDNLMGGLIKTTECDLSTSIYIIDMYKVTFTVNDDFRNCVVQTVPGLSLGWSGATPNNQNRWASLINLTDCQATFVTFAFHVWNINGSELGWFPCSPNQTTVVYQKIYTPVVNNLWQYPYPGGIYNPVVFVYSNASPPNINLYNWRDTMRTPNITFAGMGNYARVQNSFGNQDNLAENYSVKLQVGVQNSWSNWRDLDIAYSTEIPACIFAQTFIKNETIEENPILINTTRTTEMGSDYIVLQNPQYKSEELVRLNLHEIGNEGMGRIDQIELFKVSTNPYDEIAVLPSGKIISYFPGEENGKVIATVNDRVNVTDKLKYIDNDALQINDGDEITIDYVPDGMQYLVLSPCLPVNKESIGGYAVNDNGLADSFYVRPNLSNVCIDLSNHSSGRLTINAAQNFRLERVLIVSNNESAKSEVLYPKSMLLNGKDVHKELLQPDYITVNIAHNDMLELCYKNIVSTQTNSSILLKTIGRYSKNKTGSMKDVQSYMNSISNSPNPFNPVTKIRFELTRSSDVKIDVYDLAGKKISTLINEFMNEGTHEIKFDGSDLSSGVYFYRIQSGSFNATRRMILIK